MTPKSVKCDQLAKSKPPNRFKITYSDHHEPRVGSTSGHSLKTELEVLRAPDWCWLTAHWPTNHQAELRTGRYCLSGEKSTETCFERFCIDCIRGKIQAIPPCNYTHALLERQSAQKSGNREILSFTSSLLKIRWNGVLSVQNETRMYLQAWTQRWTTQCIIKNGIVHMICVN